MKTFLNTAAVIALGAGAVIGAPTTAATGASSATGIMVNFADLNLASESGTQIFDRRIKNAIETVCGGPHPRDVNRHKNFKACVKETEALVQPKRDLAINAYRDGQLASGERVIRFAAAK